MKALQISFLILLCLGFCNFVLGQTKPVALKFDVYIEKTGKNLNLLAEKTKRFAQEINKMPAETKGVILFFQSRKNFRCWAKESAEKQQFNYISKFVVSHKPANQIFFQPSSQFRENAEVEFGILPKDSEAPDAAGINIDCFCPDMYLNSVDTISRDDKLLLFVVILYGSLAKKYGNITYEWKVLDGKIVKDGNAGKGAITVDISEAKSTEITATVKLSGIPSIITKTCGNYSESFTTKILDNK